MIRALRIVIALLMIAGASLAGDLSVQSGIGFHSGIDYDYTIYGGVTYHADYLGPTLFRPEAEVGFWRARSHRTYSASYFDYAPISHVKEVDYGAFGGVRLAIDFEKISRREGNPIWPAAGGGILLNWIDGSSVRDRYLLFARMSVGVTSSASLFLEYNAHFESLRKENANQKGLYGVMKLGYRFRVS